MAKIRNGFVSNSSSSSFICDKSISLEDARDVMNILVDMYEKLYKNTDFPFTNEDFYIKIGDEEYEKDLIKNWEFDVKEKVKDHVVIAGFDNSIPSELFDLIENRCSAKRYHLG